jgi:type VI secretion system secreted protein VgrG
LDGGTLCRWLTPLPGPMCRVPTAPARQAHRQSVVGGYPPASMVLGPEGVALLKAVETLRLQAYDDQTSKDITAWVAGATIGYGHLIPAKQWVTYKAGITETQADALFAADLAPFETAVRDSITVGLQQYQFDALVIFAFNIGQGGFKGSAVVKLINDPKATTGHASLEAAWKSWNKSQGKVMKGLDNRRAAEWRIYTSADYARW